MAGIKAASEFGEGGESHDVDFRGNEARNEKLKETEVGAGSGAGSSLRHLVAHRTAESSKSATGETSGCRRSLS